MKLPKYDGRYWKLLAPACIVGVLHVLFLTLLVLISPGWNKTAFFMAIAGVPFAYSCFFYAGKTYELHCFLDDLKARDQKRSVDTLLRQLGIKEQK